MWTAIVIIVIVTMVASVIMSRYEALAELEKGKKPDESSRLAAESREAEQRELADLRERIKVLERIATDANSASALETRRVSEEIEALRSSDRS